MSWDRRCLTRHTASLASQTHSLRNQIGNKIRSDNDEYDDDGDEAAGVLTAAMYGTAIAGRAAGRKLCKDLQNYGFERGVYDRSVYRLVRDSVWIGDIKMPDPATSQVANLIFVFGHIYSTRSRDVSCTQVPCGGDVTLCAVIAKIIS